MNRDTYPYRAAIETAQSLLYEQIRDPEGERNNEYTRGVCEILADFFGKERDEVAQDIGVEVQ